MCNGITKAGKQCTRKAEWCKQHINKKRPMGLQILQEHITVCGCGKAVKQKNDRSHLNTVRHITWKAAHINEHYKWCGGVEARALTLDRTKQRAREYAKQLM
jgi:hypothetical protein